MNVGLISPGEMGQAIGATLRSNGARVVTCLAGRSERTRALARDAGIEDAPTLADLVRGSDIVLSVVPPARARDVARDVAEAKRASGSRPLFVDCNAIAPSTMREVAAIAGGDVADVGIIGAPPRGPGTRFYVAGPSADRLKELPGLEIHVLSDRVGDASALKMCYAASTKGVTALAMELMIAAEALGVGDALRGELGQRRDTLGGSIPRVPAVAHRWIGEMEEIAKTFAELGLPPSALEGAADMYRFAASSPLGTERPETRDMSRGIDGTVAALARHLGTLRRTAK